MKAGWLNCNSNKLQEQGRTGWRSGSSKKYLIVVPDCVPGLLEIVDFPARFYSLETMVERSLFSVAARSYLLIPLDSAHNTNLILPSLIGAKMEPSCKKSEPAGICLKSTRLRVAISSV